MRKANPFYLFIILCISILVCGCDYTPAGYSYTVVVSGIENYTGNGTTEILVPIPVINGSTFFTDEDMMNSTSITREHSNWTPRFINTENGKMLSLSTNEKNLTVASFRLYSNLTAHPYDESEMRILLLNYTNYTKDRFNPLKYPFYPIVEQSTNNTSSIVSIPKPVNYTSVNYTYKYNTYIYVDKNITPLPDKDHRIKIYSVIAIYEGSFSSSSGPAHSAIISEYIPEGEKGWVPVTVYVLRAILT